MSNILEIQEFFVEGDNQERSHVLLHITEPGTPAEKAKGYFFALCEINNGPLEQIEHLQQMIDDLESGYYESDDRADKNAFELTLEYINRRGHHILQYKDSVINCLVGVLRHHSIFLAYHGKPEARLFYKSKDQIEQMDIIGENGVPPVGQLFSSILEGQMNDGDVFYAASPHVVDYFTPDRVTKIIQTRNLRQSAEHVQKVLGDLNSELSFGGIMFRFPAPADVPKTGKNPLRLDNTGSAASLDKLADQEKNTEQVMSPSLIKSLQSKFDTYKQKREIGAKKKELEKVQEKRKQQIQVSEKGRIETNIRPREDGHKEKLFNIVLISFGKAMVVGFIYLLRFLRAVLFGLGRGTISLFILITNYAHQRQEVIRHIRLWWFDKKEKFSSLPILSRILFTLTILCALIFLGSIVTFKIRANIKADNLAYQNNYQAVVDKKNAADAGLLYDDTGRAFTLLTEAQTIFDQLPTNNKNRKNQKTELGKSLEETWMKIRKIVKVTPEVLFDLTANQAKVTQLAEIDNQLIAYGPDDTNFYKLNPQDKTTEKKDHAGVGKLHDTTTPKENDLIVFAVDDKNIAFYSKDSSSLLNKDISFEKENAKIAALTIYNRKLYILDAVNNQITKHSPTQTGYDKGVVWQKQALDLSDGISLAVDGDLFVLKANGEIIKLTAGEKQEFTISGLDPALKNPLVIRANTSLNNIYILEPTNKRIVVLDKTGKLLNQYTADVWQNPTGLIVSETNKTAYVLDGGKVYKFNL